MDDFYRDNKLIPNQRVFPVFVDYDEGIFFDKKQLKVLPRSDMFIHEENTDSKRASVCKKQKHQKKEIIKKKCRNAKGGKRYGGRPESNAVCVLQRTAAGGKRTPHFFRRGKYL